MKTREKGNEAEKLVCQYLEKNHYKILERNWFSGIGEIDIVAVLGKTISFVEVKKLPRTWTDDFLENKVNRTKQGKIIRSSLYYLARHDNIKYDIVSFDVASVRDCNISYYAGAFE